jgi:glucose uptake protein GlcU
MTPLVGRHDERERFIAWVLRAGAYLSFGLLVLAAAASLAGTAWAGALARAGILCLLATPLLRILTAIWMYAAERDKKMVLISAGVLLILLASSFLGVKLG